MRCRIPATPGPAGSHGSPSARALTALLAAAGLLAALSGASRAAPPPEGTCPVLTGEGGPPETREDVGGAMLEEGSVIGLDRLLGLRSLFPPQVWAQREAFFFQGMRMEIGPCHRRYPTPAFFSRATLAHWEEVELDDDGSLEGYVAGLPFPPDTIDPEAEDAGLRWAWNLQQRWRGASHVGSFRITDMPSRVGSVETYLGSFFLLPTRHRADLADQGYAVPEAKDTLWVAGGRFTEPFHARHLAWRQFRPAETHEDWDEGDRTWVYVPDMRKPRRAATAWVDGLYTPRYSASGQIAAGGGVPFAVGDQISAINPTAGVSAIATQNIRRGFVGLSLRPNAYTWSYEGERDVLAPLNGFQSGYPTNPDRNFGPSGLSPASDRWDLRRAVVIRGHMKRPDGPVAAVTYYLDWQTQQPLYYISQRANGLVLDIGIFVHRFSGDRADYPQWPGGGEALVFDPVAAAFFTVAEGGTGWRRESYDVRSVPVPPQDLQRMISVGELERGH